MDGERTRLDFDLMVASLRVAWQSADPMSPMRQVQTVMDGAFRRVVRMEHSPGGRFHRREQDASLPTDSHSWSLSVPLDDVVHIAVGLNDAKWAPQRAIPPAGILPTYSSLLIA